MTLLEYAMRLGEILNLTGAGKKTLYRWMEKHPTIDTSDPHSLLGHPFPRPTGNAGRAVVWDEKAVHDWWEANSTTVGRHPENAEVTTMSWEKFRKAMLEKPETQVDDNTGEEVFIEDDMALIQRFERQGDEVRLWFRNVTDAVFFKLT
ncbi:AlpA family phage regulatory protein, partial [Rhizorhabdus histidinilytica]